MKALENEYARKLQEARDLQRNGDLHGCADATAQADDLRKQIEELEAENR